MEGTLRQQYEDETVPTFPSKVVYKYMYRAAPEHGDRLYSNM